MGLKLLLMLPLVFLQQGSQFQLASILLVTFVQLTLHVRVLPFIDRFDNQLQFCTFALSFVTAFGGMLSGYVKVEKELTALQKVDGEARGKIENDYRDRLALVDALVDAAVYCLVIAGALLTVFEVWRNRAFFAKKARGLTPCCRRRNASAAYGQQSEGGGGDHTTAEAKSRESIELTTAPTGLHRLKSAELKDSTPNIENPIYGRAVSEETVHVSVSKSMTGQGLSFYGHRKGAGHR